MAVYAFDFDGVLCDSVNELGLAGWKTCQRLLSPPDVDQVQEAGLLAGFAEARPCLETGWESVLMLWLLHTGKSAQDLIDDFYPTLREEAMGALKQTEEELKAEFQRTRQDWIQQETESWLAAHGFYSEAVEAVKSLIIRAHTDSTIQVYIITTKAKEFAIRLLAACGLEVAEDHVFGLGSGPKVQVLETLCEKHSAQRHGCLFLEDRVQTLLSVKAKYSFPTLYLADWGYNTEGHREKARGEGIPVIDQTKLASILSK